MWKRWPIFGIEIWFFDIKNTFYLIVWGLKNAFFMPFMPPLYHYPICERAAAKSTEELGILEVGWKWLFSCVKSVSKHIES